jgi:hypothetical protein
LNYETKLVYKKKNFWLVLKRPLLAGFKAPIDNSKKPLVCLDEASKQLIVETRPSIAVGPGRVKRTDAEYRRCGTASVFMLNALV